MVDGACVRVCARACFASFCLLCFALFDLLCLVCLVLFRGHPSDVMPLRVLEPEQIWPYAETALSTGQGADDCPVLLLRETVVNRTKFLS